MSYRVSTQVYSGPFDLLLQLVTRQKVDIGAISISEVAEQYLAEAERIEALDLDVASDFYWLRQPFGHQGCLAGAPGNPAQVRRR